MKKIIVPLVIVGILFSLYSFGMAGYSYVTISNLLDDVVPRQIGTRGVSDSFAAQERNERVRAAVVKSVTDAGIVIDQSAVTTAEEGSKLAVRVSYQYPVIKYQGETKVAIPVTVTSLFPVPPPQN
jgi:hypothetical protein